MPKLSGPALAQQVRQDCPAVRVLYISGYTADALGLRGVLDRDTPLLQKPFGPKTLLQKVREMLGARA